MWLFNNAIRQNEIHSMLICGNMGNDNVASTSTQITNVSISHVLAAHPCLTEQTSCWIVMSSRCPGVDHWHKSVT